MYVFIAQKSDFVSLLSLSKGNARTHANPALWCIVLSRRRFKHFHRQILSYPERQILIEREISYIVWTCSRPNSAVDPVRHISDRKLSFLEEFADFVLIWENSKKLGFSKEKFLAPDKLTLLRPNVVGIFCHRIGICPSWQTSVRQSWVALRILGISITFLSKLYFISAPDVVQSEHEVRAFLCNSRLSLTPLMKIRPMMRIKNWKVSLSDWRSITNGFRMSGTITLVYRSFYEKHKMLRL